jgi:hypothetical protein
MPAKIEGPMLFNEFDYGGDNLTKRSRWVGTALQDAGAHAERWKYSRAPELRIVSRPCDLSVQYLQIFLLNLCTWRRLVIVSACLKAACRNKIFLILRVLFIARRNKGLVLERAIVVGVGPI